jgi:hypothetical protein
MSVEVFLKRDKISFSGKLSLIKRNEDGSVNEKKSVRDLNVRTGTARNWAKDYDWVTAKGGIPEGNFFIHVNPKLIKQRGQFRPKGREIGHAYHVSSTISNFEIIRNPKTGKSRSVIMIHPDNDVPGSGGVAGSIGCIVFPATPQGWADFQKLVTFFDEAFKNGIEHIPLTVFR